MKLVEIMGQAEAIVTEFANRDPRRVNVAVVLANRREEAVEGIGFGAIRVLRVAFVSQREIVFYLALGLPCP